MWREEFVICDGLTQQIGTNVNKRRFGAIQKFIILITFSKHVEGFSSSAVRFFESSLRCPGGAPMNDDHRKDDNRIQRACFTSYGKVLGIKTHALYLRNVMTGSEWGLKNVRSRKDAGNLWQHASWLKA